mmetsp:Transcript_25659/g.59935  ORF Transcript_25659/g.59935 Transcript_25659/m.59935 type:complete len:345 (+) Transcript_25659:284-1318(+)
MSGYSNKRSRNTRGAIRVTQTKTVSAEMQTIQKVLCVDDSPVTLKTQCHVLRRALDANGGAEVGIDRAMNGEEACAAVRAMSETGESYLLITMDLSMPKCNGVEATEHVRSNLYRGATTPIVALSSFDPLQPPLSECTPTGQLDAFTFCQEIEKPLTPPKAHQIVQQFVVPLLRKPEADPMAEEQAPQKMTLEQLSATSSEYDGSLSGSYPPSNFSVSGFESMSSDTTAPHPHLPPVMVGGTESCQMSFSPIQTPSRALGMTADPAAASTYMPAAPMPPPSHVIPFGYVSYSDAGARTTEMMATDCVPADLQLGGKGFYRPQDGTRQAIAHVGGGPPEADSLTA